MRCSVLECGTAMYVFFVELMRYLCKFFRLGYVNSNKGGELSNAAATTTLRVNFAPKKRKIQRPNLTLLGFLRERTCQLAHDAFVMSYVQWAVSLTLLVPLIASHAHITFAFPRRTHYV